VTIAGAVRVWQALVAAGRAKLLEDPAGDNVAFRARSRAILGRRVKPDFDRRAVNEEDTQDVNCLNCCQFGSNPCPRSPSPFLLFLPRQNSMALALRELGRIERTLFTLEWLRDPTLRRRMNDGLNKGEARNALARAVLDWGNCAIGRSRTSDIATAASIWSSPRLSFGTPSTAICEIPPPAAA
jgi:hypothetical protein